MRYFLTRSVPAFPRVLLVESGSRGLLERIVPVMYSSYGEELVVDIVTCYAGSPSGLHENSTVFRTGEYPGPQGRVRLLGQLRERAYPVVAILCSDEPILTKWKWWLAAKLPAKVLIINENGDWFWLDRSHLGTVVRFALFRAGLTGAGAIPTLTRFAAFPFMLAYLLAFAAWIHLKRAFRRLSSSRAI